MAPDERRADLVDVTLRLLRVHGRDVTTRQIAEAAGIAEGTVFRAFPTKEELVDAAVARAFEPGDLVARIEEIDPDLPLRERLVDPGLDPAAALPGDLRADAEDGAGRARPSHLHDSEAAAWRARLAEGCLRAPCVGDDADRLAVPVERLRARAAAADLRRQPRPHRRRPSC